MTLNETLKLLIPILGGGALGALITAVITSHRNKIQPVGMIINANGSILPQGLIKQHEAKITITNSGKDYQFSNIYIASIIIVNKGNKDIADFEFGLTLPDKLAVINVVVKSADRSHTLTYAQEVNFDSGKDILDFNASPFNRKDRYEIELTIAGDGEYFSSDIKLSSKLPVKFVTLDIVDLTYLPSLLDILSSYLIIDPRKVMRKVD